MNYAGFNKCFQLVLVVITVVFITSCAGVPAREGIKSVTQQRKIIVKTAKSMIGNKKIVVNNKKYNYDCSNFVRAVYMKSIGIDLFQSDPVSDVSDSVRGAKLICQYCRMNGDLYEIREPVPADLIFFDDTSDRNKNDKLDDELTHVGLVEKINRQGTITFIHLLSEGIVRSKMNLSRPAEHENKYTNEIYNSYLRKKTKANPSEKRTLTGELFNSFGSVLTK
jgi:hypothetical protein